jgi:hypothetical protein
MTDFLRDSARPAEYVCDLPVLQQGSVEEAGFSIEIIKNNTAGIAGKVLANKRDKLKLANGGKFELYPNVKTRKSIFHFLLNSSNSPSCFTFISVGTN